MTEVEAGPPASPVPRPPTSRRRPRARYFVAAAVCAGIVVWMLTVLQRNVVYLKPVSEAVAARDEQGTRTFRMGGAVVPGTIAETDDGVRFVVTEGGDEATVVLHGDPPDLFRNCAPVVVEGRWKGNTFDATRLLIKHGSDYRPPKSQRAECDANTDLFD
jgi:cytochrome c-type biogenesis protein CcmE